MVKNAYPREEFLKAVDRALARIEQISDEEALIGGVGSALELRRYRVQWVDFLNDKPRAVPAILVGETYEKYKYWESSSKTVGLRSITLDLITEALAEFSNGIPMLVEDPTKFLEDVPTHVLRQRARRSFLPRFEIRLVREVAKELGIVEQYDAMCAQLQSEAGRCR